MSAANLVDKLVPTMPGRNGGTLKAGNVVGVGRKPNPVRNAMRRVSVAAAKKAEQLLAAQDFDQVRYAMDWAGKHGIGSVDARVKAQTPQAQAQQQNLNVGFKVMGPNDPHEDGEIPV